VSRLGKLIFAIMFLGGMLDMAQAAEQSRTVKTQSPGTFQVNVSQGYLSLEANQASLVTIFQEIGKQAKITFDGNIGLEEKITIHLNRVPLEEGIKQLAKNATVFYAENPKDKTRRITRVVVLSEGKQPPSGQTKTSEQAVKIDKPAPQPEPFKFEFDPAKSAEKEKARKP